MPVLDANLSHADRDHGITGRYNRGCHERRHAEIISYRVGQATYVVEDGVDGFGLLERSAAFLKRKIARREALASGSLRSKGSRWRD